MSDNDSKKKNSDDFVWEPNRKVVSKLPSSEHIMDDNRKELIRKALEFDIIDVRSYIGYRGDLLVEFTTLDNNTVISLKKTAEALNQEVVIRQDQLMVYQVYCITPTDDIYGLKM